MRSAFIILLMLLTTIVFGQETEQKKFGIEGQIAPSWDIGYWIDGEGNETDLKLEDYNGKVVYMMCFQHWCPGCHDYGFPTLKYLQRSYERNQDVTFVAIQTVFEGQQINNEKKLKKSQKKYKLNIPFGHDDGANMDRKYSNVMHNYRTGGTPWVIIIDKSGKVVFNDYNIEPKYANRIIQKALKEE